MPRQETAVIDLNLYAPSRFWMRSVSFVGLRNLIKLLQQYPKGLTAKEIVALIENTKTILVKANQVPKPTTIYHYRNTLLHLGVLQRKKGLLELNTGDTMISNLLAHLGDGDTLSSTEKHIFAELVIAQEDCKLFFADVFLFNEEEKYSLVHWLNQAKPVYWNETGSENGRKIELRTVGNNKRVKLSTQNHIQALLYGVRYWFRDELKIMDELFREDIGNMMFPIFPDEYVSNHTIILKLLEQVNDREEWTRIALRDLAVSLCVQLRISVDRLYSVIRDLQRSASGFIVLIPTSRSFATITASSSLRENYELRSYLMNERGEYISHVRVHRRIKEVTT